MNSSKWLMRKLSSLFIASFLGVSLTLTAQYSGQYPTGTGQYPPGQYPPGQYPPGQQGPMGGSGVPVPWGKKGSKDKKQESAKQPTFSAEGQTVTNDGKQLVIQTNDGRTITMALTTRTKYVKGGTDIQASKLIPRTTVHVDASEDGDSNLTAVTVELLKDAPTEQSEARPSIQQHRQSAPQPEVDNTAIPDPTALGKAPDDPNRPVLRRGKPQSRTTNSAAANKDDKDKEDTTVASNTRPARPTPSQPLVEKKDDPTDFTIGDDADKPKGKGNGSELIAKAVEWAGSFTNGLPNFVCQQVTTRYLQESKSEGWQALDILTAKVVYENGKESYKEITVGGKKTGKSMLDLGGSTSTGEFASTLQSLFSERSQTEFKFVQSTTIGSTQAAIYDFKVALPNSDWFIKVAAQALKPAYSGSVWIDRKTAEVRRIEMQADKIPQDFPLDSVQWAVDYDVVRLGTASFLLPVHAENLSCQRGTTICSKNAVDFRDYHKYSGESTITFK